MRVKNNLAILALMFSVGQLEASTVKPPSFDRFQAYIDEAVSAKLGDCSPNGVEAILEEAPASGPYPHGNPLEGGLRILASKYQSCKILDNVMGTPGYIAPSPGVINAWRKKGEYPVESNKCIDAKTLKTQKACRVEKKFCISEQSTPLEYAQGWRDVDYDPKTNTLEILESASDCSSFVVSAMRAVGLKMNKNDTYKTYPQTTTAILNAI